jgi:hypothetical protein
VQVARALAFDCRVLVLDEPTTSLTDAEVDHLFGVLRRLKSEGVTIIFVSHRIPEIFRLADRVTVLRDGTFVRTFDRDACTPDDVVRAMVGREPPERVPRETREGPAVPALALRDASRGRAFRHVSLDVCAGEIVGLRSELMTSKWIPPPRLRVPDEWIPPPRPRIPDPWTFRRRARSHPPSLRAEGEAIQKPRARSVPLWIASSLRSSQGRQQAGGAAGAFMPNPRRGRASRGSWPRSERACACGSRP